ncbi:MAG: hypothetical protein FWD97_00515 [Defluviitaleaceae bacterium]|nr:hypothetical protein [Defluviitaleaceae bacterium]
MWVYRKSQTKQNTVYEVGFFEPNGEFNRLDCVFSTEETASEQVRYLNGGNWCLPPKKRKEVYKILRQGCIFSTAVYVAMGVSARLVASEAIKNTSLVISVIFLTISIVILWFLIIEKQNNKEKEGD